MPTPSPTPAVAAPPLAELTASLAGKRALGADDAMAVRRAVYAADATISREEAEALVALNDAAASSAPEWKDLYVEALTDYVVYQQDPRGYVDEDRARWLMAQVARDGRIKTGTELELLIHVLERADAAPADLAGFVLDMVRRSILAERPGRPHPAIQAADVERLRRVVYAAGGPDNVAVTRAEAEALLDPQRRRARRGQRPGLDRLLRPGGRRQRDGGLRVPPAEPRGRPERRGLAGGAGADIAPGDAGQGGRRGAPGLPPHRDHRGPLARAQRRRRRRPRRRRAGHRRGGRLARRPHRPRRRLRRQREGADRLHRRGGARRPRRAEAPARQGRRRLKTGRAEPAKTAACRPNSS
ncbi:MAG: hypothetical protein WDM92_04310 [Caulobacteraceae bacterium]